MPVRSTPQYRVDSSKPFDGNAIARVEVDIVIDTEKDRGRIPASSCSVQPQSRLSVCYAAVVPACEIRRRRPTGFAVLVIADDLKTAARSASVYSRVMGFASKFAPGRDSDRPLGQIEVEGPYAADPRVSGAPNRKRSCRTGEGFGCAA